MTLQDLYKQFEEGNSHFVQIPFYAIYQLTPAEFLLFALYKSERKRRLTWAKIKNVFRSYDTYKQARDGLIEKGYISLEYTSGKQNETPLVAINPNIWVRNRMLYPQKDRDEALDQFRAAFPDVGPNEVFKLNKEEAEKQYQAFLKNRQEQNPESSSNASNHPEEETTSEAGPDNSNAPQNSKSNDNPKKNDAAGDAPGAQKETPEPEPFDLDAYWFLAAYTHHGTRQTGKWHALSEAEQDKIGQESKYKKLWHGPNGATESLRQYFIDNSLSLLWLMAFCHWHVFDRNAQHIMRMFTSPQKLYDQFVEFHQYDTDYFFEFKQHYEDKTICYEHLALRPYGL